ncbi:PREDICTED: uncharacterized protein LOC108615868 [Drosophila arizonae]|uniref:Uncharacterized protein LOC108615868 n=1 Tax=Drosophila arizonae TaxID=7263 RepID=A0ABM1PG48_DROAR|nr:PREDICTED: uncharacterized protein LOC108615868 [Drosophila arizonae]
MHNCKFQVLTKCIARNLDNAFHFLKILPACCYSGRGNACVGRIAVSMMLRNGYSQDYRCILFSRRSDNEKLLAFKNRMTSCADVARKYDYLMDLMKENINLYYRYLCDNTAEVLTVVNAVDSALDNISNLGLSVTKSPNMQRLVHVTRSLDFDRTVNHIRQYIDAENKKKAQTRFGFALKKKQKEQKTGKQKDRQKERLKEKDKHEKPVRVKLPRRLKKNVMKTPKRKYVIYLKRYR